MDTKQGSLFQIRTYIYLHINNKVDYIFYTFEGTNEGKSELG